MVDVEKLSYEECLKLQGQLGKLLGRVRTRLNKLQPPTHQSLAVSTLAAMAVGDTVVMHQRVHNDTRIAARKRLSDPNAQWSTKTLSNGFRVTRIR